MPLLIIAHETLGADCDGCINEVVEESGSRYFCNACQAEISIEDVGRAVMEMPSVDIPCPHCGRTNEISGFVELSAFICRFCGQGVAR